MQSIALKDKSIIGKETPPFISWESFKSKYLTREDGFKYEWLNGTIEKTKRTMDSTQFYILSNILTIFREYQRLNNIDGELISEGDVFFLDKHRRPDIAYFNAQQIDDAADGQRPNWVASLERCTHPVSPTYAPAKVGMRNRDE